MADLKKWLLRPYPFPVTLKSKLLISLGFGKFVFLFLLLFKPFDFNQLEDQVLYYAFIYGVITMGILMFNLFLLPLLFKEAFNPNTWSIYKMILFILEIVIFISLINTIFSRQTNHFFVDHKRSFLFFLKNVVLVSLFPNMVYIYLVERISNKKHQTVANSISSSLEVKQSEDENSRITIYGTNKNELLHVIISDLIYISSEKNYASIFHFQNGIIKETLLRVSLSNIEDQLKDYSAIVRNHKSYIVNTNKVVRIKGNARSYLLEIPEIDFLLPVSRSFPKELLFTLVK